MANLCRQQQQNLFTSSRIVPEIFVRFYTKFGPSRQISIKVANYKVSRKSLHWGSADMDGHDEADRRHSLLRERAQ